MKKAVIPESLRQRVIYSLKTTLAKYEKPSTDESGNANASIENEAVKG